jgi:DNA-binding Xre family transcriptional regulator
MAMKWRVREIAERVGIENAAQLAARTNLGLTSAYQLWNGTAEMVAVRTLNTLCNVLQVGPAQLFDYTPDVEPVTGSAQDEGVAKVRKAPARKGSRKLHSLGTDARL